MGCFPWFPRKVIVPVFPVPFGKVGEDDANAKSTRGVKMFRVNWKVQAGE